jgi:dTDP-4-amino-4,6-dideoxygalactose transaminase
MKINIVRPIHPDLSEISSEFTECLETGLVTNNSKYVRKFETELQKYFSSSNKPVTFCNGEMALFNLIQAHKIKLGFDVYDTFDVLVPSFTFSGTVNAIVANNLKPIFCDINETLTIDAKKLNLITENIKMIVAVGVYGNLPDIMALSQFAKKNNLVLIFDNAPAFGAMYKGHFPNHYDCNEIYSLHATKIFSSMEGGIAVVNDSEIENTLIKLKNFGQFNKDWGNVDVPGLNSKMQEISAIVGLKNLEKLDYILTNRKRNIEKYRNFFQEYERKGLLKNMIVPEDNFCPYLYYPIILNEEATKFINYLFDNDIIVRRYYAIVHKLKYYENKYKELNLDFTNSINGRIVSIPIFSEMSRDEINYLFNTIEKYFN